MKREFFFFFFFNVYYIFMFCCGSMSCIYLSPPAFVFLCISSCHCMWKERKREGGGGGCIMGYVERDF